MTVPFMYDMYNFRSLSNKFPTIFRCWHFQVSLPKLGYFCRKNETENFRIEKCDLIWSDVVLEIFNFFIYSG